MPFAEMSPLFAQRAVAGGGGGDEAAGTAVAVVMMVAYFAFIVFALVGGIMLLVGQYQALKACSPRNRTMEPGHVFFVFIPLAGIVFAIMALFKVPDSLEREFRSRGIRSGGEDYGKTLGVWYLVTAFVCFIVAPVIALILGSKLNKLAKRLNSGAKGDDLEDDVDEDDDRPSRRRSREDDDDDRDRRRGRYDDEEDDDRPRRR